MLCTSPLSNAKLVLPALIVEPPHATVQVHHEVSASYVSSLATAVWRPLHIYTTSVCSTHWFIDRHRQKHRLFFVGCRNVQTGLRDHQLSTTRVLKNELKTTKNVWKFTAGCHIANRSACQNHCNTTAKSTLLDSSRCHRHGGCHSRCRGDRSVFVMAVSMVTLMVVVIVVTAASLQGHGCQGSKEKCSLTVPVVTWRSFRNHWDARRAFFEINNYVTPTSKTAFLQTTQHLQHLKKWWQQANIYVYIQDKNQVYILIYTNIYIYMYIYIMPLFPGRAEVSGGKKPVIKQKKEFA